MPSRWDGHAGGDSDAVLWLRDHLEMGKFVALHDSLSTLIPGMFDTHRRQSISGGLYSGELAAAVLVRHATSPGSTSVQDSDHSVGDETIATQVTLVNNEFRVVEDTWRVHGARLRESPPAPAIAAAKGNECEHHHKSPRIE